MTEIFNTNKIRSNDPLRNEKIEALNRIERAFEKWVGKHIVEDSHRVEHFLEKLCGRYSEKWQDDEEMLDLVNMSGDVYNEKFWGGGWHEWIVKTKRKNRVQKISNVMEKAILREGPQLSKAVEELETKNSDLNELNYWEFEKRYPYSTGAGSDWNYVLAREIIMDRMKTKYERKKGVKNGEQRANPAQEKEANLDQLTAENILRNIRNVKFYKGRYGIEVKNPSKNLEFYFDDRLEEWKKWIKRNIKDLKDELLLSGKKKADLSRELERTIEKGVNSVSESKVDDNASVTSVETDSSSIFSDESSNKDYDSDSSSFTSIDDTTGEYGFFDEDVNNKKDTSDTPKEESVEQLGDRIIKEITALLQENSISESEFDATRKLTGQHGLMGKIEFYSRGAGKSFSDAQRRIGISNAKWEFEFYVEKIVKTRENASNLDNLSQKFENGSAKVEINDIAIFNESSGDDKNQEKEQKARVAMMKSEGYFENLVNWVKDEESKLNEVKEENDEDSTPKVKYTEEEEKFLNGEITDPEKKKEVAEQVKTKVNVKKKGWDLKKKLNKALKWAEDAAKKLLKQGKKKVEALENKAKQIKKELKNIENGSNRYERQAYQENKEQVNKLVAKLDVILQNNQTVAPTEKSFFHPEVMIPVSIVALLAIVATIVVIRRKKLTKIKK